MPLRPGTFARVSFPIGTKPRLVAPTTALTSFGALDRVFVVDGGRARLRMITRGEAAGAVDRDPVRALRGRDASSPRRRAELRDGTPRRGSRRDRARQARRRGQARRARSSTRSSRRSCSSPRSCSAPSPCGSCPREEEPQIIVPMSDVFVRMPGASAKEVEAARHQAARAPALGDPRASSTCTPHRARASRRSSSASRSARTKSAAWCGSRTSSPRTWTSSRRARRAPLVKPRSIDDVPVLAVTLWSKRYSGYELRRLAGELQEQVKQVRRRERGHAHRRRAPAGARPARSRAARRAPALAARDRGRGPGRQQRARRRAPSSSDNRELLLETGHGARDRARRRRRGRRRAGRAAGVPARRRDDPRRPRGAVDLRALRRRARPRRDATRDAQRRVVPRGHALGREAQGRERRRRRGRRHAQDRLAPRHARARRRRADASRATTARPPRDKSNEL